MSDQLPPAGGDSPPSPPPYGQAAPQPPPYGQPPYGQPPAYGQDPYAPQAPQPAYGQDPYAPTAPPAYGQDPYAPQPAYGQQPYAQQPYGQPAFQQYPAGAFPFTAKDPDKRPGTVMAACIIAIVGSAITLIGSGLMALVMATSRDSMMSELDGSGDLQGLNMSSDDLYTFLQTMFVVFLVWSILGVLLGVFAMRRSNVARILLVVSSALVAVVSLLAIGSLLPALWLLAAIATIVLLFVGGANDWYARRSAAPAQGYQPYQQL